MKKIILTLVLSLCSFQIWACSCYYLFISFADAWTTAIEEGWGLPPLVECVAVEEACGGILFVVNNVVYEGSGMSDIAAGDTIKLWNGNGADCISSLGTPIGDTLMIPLGGFWPGDFDLEACPDIEQYPNHSVDICGPTTLPIVNGNVGDFTYEEFEEFIEESLTWEVTNVNLKIILEGAYQGTGNNMNEGQWNVPYFPWGQPFNVEPYNHDTEDYSGLWGSDNIVDWVLVEAREGTPQISGERGTKTVETITGLVTTTGDIIDTHGSSLKFLTLDPAKTYHFCIRHRNHLDVLTATALAVNEEVNYDFTTSVDQAFGYGQQKWNEDGTKALMYVGDYNQDGVIQLSDFDAWKANPAQVDVYSPLDGTLDGIVQVTDYDAWLPNKAKIGVVEIEIE